MRDPGGRLRLVADQAIRRLSSEHDPVSFLTDPIAQRLVRDGLLIPFEFASADALVSPRQAFVTQPTEWTDAQLHDAGQLTLELAERALAGRYELKDASAWNVLFEGTHAHFCDHLSFQPIRSRQWWAFGQFCRHFAFPLACARWRGIHCGSLFQMHRDGLPAELAKQILGCRGFASRLMPLLIYGGHGVASLHESATTNDQPAETLHGAVIRYARASLLAPRTGGQRRSSVPWSSYVTERPHYGDAALQAKREQVMRWLAELSPTCVLDLGCNTGEISRLALSHAQRVVALDSDHDSVQRLYEAVPDDRRLYPVLANLGDMRGGRGWSASEVPGLLERLEGLADVAMMLAVVHHLHLSEGIPMEEVAALTARLTTRHLIVELVDGRDEMALRLAQQRRRSLEGFSLAQQLHAFGRHFRCMVRCALPGMARELVLMSRLS